jgi:hypothetical protein
MFSNFPGSESGSDSSLLSTGCGRFGAPDIAEYGTGRKYTRVAEAKIAEEVITGKFRVQSLMFET